MSLFRGRQDGQRIGAALLFFIRQGIQIHESQAVGQTGLHTKRFPALFPPVRAGVAFHGPAGSAAHLRGAVGADPGTGPAADAFCRIDGDRSVLLPVHGAGEVLPFVCVCFKQRIADEVRVPRIVIWFLNGFKV